jgi:cobalamin biosynthesis protein CbiD
MHHGKWRLVAGTAAVALVAGGGSAFATSSHSASKSGGRGAVLSAVAGYLGLTTQQFAAGLRSGETMAQIATAQGKSVSGLEQAIEAAVRSRLDQAVAAGKITSRREQLILSRLPARLDKLVNSTHPGAVIRHALLRKGLIRVSAAYLGLTPQALGSQLRAGKTLAQIATAQDKSVAGLKEAIQTAVEKRLAKAVANGRLTREREQRIVAHLPSWLDMLVNRTLAHA